MRNILLNIIIALLPLLSFSQDKVFVLTDKDNYRIYVDSQGNRAYLNVIQYINDPVYHVDQRRYEIKKIIPDSNHIRYILGCNQMCIFNQVEGKGLLCEEVDYDIKCFQFSR